MKVIYHILFKISRGKIITDLKDFSLHCLNGGKFFGLVVEW